MLPVTALLFLMTNREIWTLKAFSKALH